MDHTVESFQPELKFKPKVPPPRTARRLSAGLRRAVLHWLLTHDEPDGIAVDVPLRLSNIRADVAAFWSITQKSRELNLPLRQPVRSLLAVCAVSRHEIWPECAEATIILQEAARLQEQLRLGEARIRQHEPQLRDDTMLFEEFAAWNYEKSQDPEYRRQRTELLALEKILYAGSRLLRLLQSRAADAYLLAVPAGVLDAHELIAPWGLLWVHPDLRVEVRRPPQAETGLPEARLHLIQNMAMAAGRDVCFRCGLEQNAQGEYLFTPLPRRRRGPDKPRL